MEQINTAILSFGMSGRVFHAPFIALHPGFKLAGVLERTKQESLQFYPDIHIYRTVEEVLEDASIELVIVNTPTHTHYDFCKRALQAGKHVVVEKAFTTTVAEARELNEIAIAKNLMLSVYQNRRWDSDFSTVRSVVQSGELGEIIEAEFHFDRYKEALSPKLHKEVPGPGAGLLNDLGPHLIDQALSLFGMPNEVFANIKINRPNSLVDDYVYLLLLYPTKNITLKTSLLVREPMPAFIVHGTKGSFIKTRADIQEAALLANEKPNTPNWGVEPISEQGLLHTERNGKIIKEKISTLAGNYAQYYEGIYKAITTHSPAPVTATDGIHVMRILEAAIQSSASKSAIKIESI
ncbi:MAG: Gfo/Idh/MocA family oxidoreductase [Sediminibacterium sp.]|nr:Gfo/Idh/MocA family oxidoreductase [Sediminibacterium sp.]